MSRRAKSPLTVAARMARRVPDYAAALGQEGAAICRRFGLTAALLSDRYGRVPLDGVLGALEELAALSRHPSPGLLLAQTAPPDIYHTPGLILVASQCLRDGLRRAFRYQRLWGDGERFALHEPRELGRTEHGLAVSFTIPGPRRPGHAILEACALAETAMGVRIATGRGQEAPLALGLPETSDDPAALESYFGIRPELGTARAFGIWSEEVMTQPLRMANELFRNVFERQAQAELDSLPAVDDLLARVSAEIRRGLARGRFALADSAQALGLGSRTLERRLVERGSHYRELVERVRRDTARRLLSERRPIDEVAVLLGYSERASFHRACVRWFGQTPAQLAAESGAGLAPG